MKLNLEIIKSFNLPIKKYKPDYDDMGYIITLPNGIELSTLFVCNGEPCESNMLEGFDGWICIDTKEELEELISSSLDEVIEKIEKENPEFDI